MARVLDQPAYDLTVFKVHFGPLTLKLYDKGARVLRIEAIAHNVKGLRCGKSVEKLPIMLATLQRMVIDFLNVVQAAHHSFLPDGILDALIEPTQRGQRRLAGVDLQKPRLRAVAEALLALAPKPGGFTLAELAERVRQVLPTSSPTTPHAMPVMIFRNCAAKRWSNASNEPDVTASAPTASASWPACWSCASG